ALQLMRLSLWGNQRFYRKIESRILDDIDLNRVDLSVRRLLHPAEHPSLFPERRRSSLNHVGYLKNWIVQDMQKGCFRRELLYLSLFEASCHQYAAYRDQSACR